MAARSFQLLRRDDQYGMSAAVKHRGSPAEYVENLRPQHVATNFQIHALQPTRLVLLLILHGLYRSKTMLAGHMGTGLCLTFGKYLTP